MEIQVKLKIAKMSILFSQILEFCIGGEAPLEQTELFEFFITIYQFFSLNSLVILWEGLKPGQYQLCQHIGFPPVIHDQ